jgi:thiol-disulfide isomerase/thioredoxin
MRITHFGSLLLLHSSDGTQSQGFFPETVKLPYPPSMRRIFSLLVLSCLTCGSAHAIQRPPSSEDVLATAKSIAVSQHKPIFLVFGASWCPPCRQMEAFMKDPKIRPILEKYFVLANLNVQEEHGKHPELNNPGGEKLLADYGGESMGIPFIVFLDAEGQLLVNSNRPVKGKPAGENIGYPALPVEIDWFMTMLHKTLPTLTKIDADTVESWLRKASAY